MNIISAGPFFIVTFFSSSCSSSSSSFFVPAFSQGPKADAEILCLCRRTYFLSIADITKAEFLVPSFGLHAMANSRVQFYVFRRWWNCSDEPIRVDSTETSLSDALFHSLTHSLTHLRTDTYTYLKQRAV